MSRANIAPEPPDYEWDQHRLRSLQIMSGANIGSGVSRLWSLLLKHVSVEDTYIHNTPLKGDRSEVLYREIGP